MTTPISAWIESMETRLARLEDRYLTDGFALDFSAASLAALESAALRRFSTGADLLTDEGRDFVACAAGYLGETLLRVAGGGWRWDEDPSSRSFDSPVVIPDERTGLAPVAPSAVMVDCVRERTGTVCTAIHTGFSRAVAAARAADPTWSPDKEWTPVVDSTITPVTSEFLATWSAERAAAFPRWSATYGATDWDFSPDSLDDLEELTRAHLGSPADFEKAENREFLEGACWYFGEVVRRNTAAVWSYHPGEPDPFDPWVGRPHVRGPRNGSVPYYVLMLAVGEPGFLREEFRRYA
ncbi:hypothetical protein ACWEKT_19400 [Nocardia takedensis]